METRELIKEAVKVEVIKLMAQELLKEDSFEKMKSELAAELFAISTTPNQTIIEPGAEETGKIAILRELNSEWGYDPINREEEKVKRALGFLYNSKNLGKGFKGDEITEEEQEFMKNSFFTKRALIKELQEKIGELEKNIIEDEPEKNEFNRFSEKLIKEELKSERHNLSKSASDKLAEFKRKFYESPLAEGTPESVVDGLTSKEKDKLINSSSASAVEQYKLLSLPEESQSLESNPGISNGDLLKVDEVPNTKKKRATKPTIKKKQTRKKK